LKKKKKRVILTPRKSLPAFYVPETPEKVVTVPETPPKQQVNLNLRTPVTIVIPPEPSVPHVSPNVLSVTPEIQSQSPPRKQRKASGNVSTYIHTAFSSRTTNDGVNDDV
jgi:hypothetical protein